MTDDELKELIEIASNLDTAEAIIAALEPKLSKLEALAYAKGWAACGESGFAKEAASIILGGPPFEGLVPERARNKT